MLKWILPTIFACCALPVLAAERSFDFGQFTVGQCPTGFVSAVSGEGKPGEWKVVEDDVPSLLPSLSPMAPKVSKRPVLAQMAQDTTDEHFPVLFFEEEEFGDFTLTTRFKIVGGAVEQMAGLAFRARDEKNYYVVRVSALGNNVRFYKFVNGERTPPIGNEMSIPTNVWHELKVQCAGNEIRCFLNNKECMPALHDTSFSFGKIGFWTKSDSVVYFLDTHLSYTPRVSLAQIAVNEVMEKYPRLLGLQIYASTNGELPRIIASSKKEEVGQVGSKLEAGVIKNRSVGQQKALKSVAVVFPLRDRNGDVAGALKVIMRPVLGEMLNTTIARAMPVRLKTEARLETAKSLQE